MFKSLDCVTNIGTLLAHWRMALYPVDCLQGKCSDFVASLPEKDMTPDACIIENMECDVENRHS